MAKRIIPQHLIDAIEDAEVGVVRARAYYSEAKEALRAEEAVFKAFKRDYAKEYKGWVLARKRLKRVKAAASSWTSRNRKWALAHLDKALGVAQ